MTCKKMPTAYLCSYIYCVYEYNLDYRLFPLLIKILNSEILPFCFSSDFFHKLSNHNRHLTNVTTGWLIHRNCEVLVYFFYWRLSLVFHADILKWLILSVIAYFILKIIPLYTWKKICNAHRAQLGCDQACIRSQAIFF
jgi:hypothetical protein